ncbi:MAG TPA: triphosphoribosyl-dephospho-CoA synthase, partial [Methanocorpusculum sp.]|nr:triphosphoribosyl-dephospho-CoA synthase [Methanocorpusculum sp.]
VRETTVDDAINFYRAFGETQVRVAEKSDMDVNDPTSLEKLREHKMTLYDVMAFSAENDMVAREWTNGFKLTREMADTLKKLGGASHISEAFLAMLAKYPDTFVIKKFGPEIADQLCNFAQMTVNSRMSVEMLDAWCLRKKINPGSLADICTAGIFVALLEGWEWDS